MHILATSILGKSQNHSGMHGYLILPINIAEATQVLC